MFDELAADRPELALGILHVNGAGYESGNADLAAVTDLPILQDDETAQVWTNWGAEWRDVYVLNADNEVHAVYNLTDHPLSEAANYAELYDLFLEAGGL